MTAPSYDCSLPWLLPAMTVPTITASYGNYSLPWLLTTLTTPYDTSSLVWLPTTPALDDDWDSSFTLLFPTMTFPYDGLFWMCYA